MRQQPEIGLLLSAIPTEDNSKTEALIKSKIAFGLSTCVSPTLASYELATALEIRVGLNYILTESMRGGRLRAWKRIQDPAGELARFLMRNPNHSKKIRARCSLCVPVCM